MTSDAAASMPQSIARLLNIEMPFHTIESFSKGTKFVPDPSDVMIVCPPKSGLTWATQICHGLRSKGDMSFDEIGCVVPLLEFAEDAGYRDLQAAQSHAPRMFKTMMWYPLCPKGAKKKPADAAVSRYYFRKDWMFAEGEVRIDDYVKWIVLGQPKPDDSTIIVPSPYFMASWYPHRKDENVLWLHFEDLKENLSECVRLIAEFLDIGKDDKELQKLVTHQATYEFMKAHDLQFDEHPIKLARNEAVGLPREAGTNGTAGKVRKGAINDSERELSPELLNAFDKQWKEAAMPVMGYATYDEMRASINEELGRNFS